MNRQKWSSYIDEKKLSSEDKYIVINFLIKDDILIENYRENNFVNNLFYIHSNLETWEDAQCVSADENVRSSKIKCTPTFRKHFANSRLNRSMIIPDWFYIAYPDVAVWLNNNLDNYEREILKYEKEFEKKSEIRFQLFRFFINEYKKNTQNTLECVIDFNQ